MGWKCVAEFFCDVTATMVPQRVSLSKAQLAIRGDLIVSCYHSELHTNIGSPGSNV